MTGTPERRRDLELRKQIDEAYELIAPFFEPSAHWAGHPQDLLAYRTLRDRMPALDAARAHLIVAVARRIHDERRARS